MYKTPDTLWFIDETDVPASYDDCSDDLRAIVKPEECEPVVPEKFPELVSEAVRNIHAHCDPLPMSDDVLLLERLRKHRERLEKIQERCGYSTLQLLMWSGDEAVRIIQKFRV